jgi:ferric-dicitrate binding protein FerR (iron transport regulator)
MDNLYLLIKYYNGETNESEMLFVEKWLESPENKKEYEKYIKIWNASKGSASLENINTQLEWEQVLKKSGRSYRVMRLDIIKWTSVASVFLLLFGLYWFFISGEKQIEMLYVKNSLINKTKIVKLGDGTVVSLNCNASIKYPKVFNEQKRVVELDGNAFFEVKRDISKPFEVITGDYKVKVLGTSFDVNSNGNQTTVVVKTGKVRVSSRVDKNNFIDLLPSDQALCVNNKIIKSKVKNQNYVAWKTKSYKFSDSKLIEVFEVLKKGYSFNYHFEKEAYKDLKFSAEFKNKSLKDIIEIIQLSCQIKINLKSNILTISEHE